MDRSSMSPSEVTQWPPFKNENRLLFNPKSSQSAIRRYREAFGEYEKGAGGTGNLGLLTSGTTATHADDFKIIVLKQEAFESSAKSVNQWIQASSEDRWSLSLPRFHVGGISVLVRASLIGSEVVPYGEKKWNPETFQRHLIQEKISLASLVPTQVFDLVRLNLRSPSHLRCVFVGGGELRTDLWTRALDLGWPLLVTFGMTEMCSQVAVSVYATTGDRSMDLFLLPHIQARTDLQQKLQLRSSAQLSAKIEMASQQLKIYNYFADDWFETEDYAELQGIDQKTRLISLGRGIDFVKIKGENVGLKKLRNIWMRQFKDEELAETSYLFAKPDTRDGNVILVAVTSGELKIFEEAKEKYNEQVLPFERIHSLVEIPQIPRSDLGKVLVSKILEMIK